MGRHHNPKRGLATRARQNRDCTIATGIVIASFVIPLALVKPQHEHIFGTPAAARTPPAALADPTPELLFPTQRVVPLRLLALPEFKPALEHRFEMPTVRESVRPVVARSVQSGHINAGEGKHRADSSGSDHDSGSHQDSGGHENHSSHDTGQHSDHEGHSSHDGGHGSGHEGHSDGGHSSHSGGHSGGHGGHGGGHGGHH